MYKLEWEMVKQNELHRFCNADPRWYSNTRQTVPNSQIPDEYWHKMSKPVDGPTDQYHTLKKWAAEDVEFIRNVKLYKAKDPVVDWVEVEDV